MWSLLSFYLRRGLYRWYGRENGPYTSQVFFGNSISTYVMINLGCQLDYIWNQWKSKQLATSVRNFLDCVIWGGKRHPKAGPYFWWPPTQMDMRDGSFCVLPTFPLTLSGKFISSATESFFAGVRIQCREKISWEISLMWLNNCQIHGFSTRKQAFSD